MSKKLEGKVAVVTGGNSGIGQATARRFVAEGARVFITGRDKAQLAAALETLGNKATAVQGVVTDPGDLDRLYARIMEDTRAVDVLFANAGVVEFAKFGEVTEEHFRRVFDLNVQGTYFTVVKALPLTRDGGSIILNGSLSWDSGEDSVVVGAARDAITAGRVPGEEQGDAVKDILRANNPSKRLADPVEIAKLAVYLASDDSAYVVGADFLIDGGATAISAVGA